MSGGVSIDDTILELLPVGVFVCDAEGVIQRFNQKAAEIWGRAPDVGHKSERFCGAYRAWRADGTQLTLEDMPVAEVLRTGAVVRNLEVQIEQPNGTRLWVLIHVEPIRSKTGQVLGAINTFQDITSRKVTEQRLQESEELLRKVIDNTPECVKIVSQDGTLLQMNPAGLRMIGAESAEQALGAHVSALIAPEHLDHWLEKHAQVCQGNGCSWEFDIIGLRGTRRHMETTAVRLSMPNGETAQLAVTRDITERKKYETALRERERHFRELLEALPTAVYTTDAAGRVTFYNEAAAEFWGFRPEVGKTEWCGSWRLYWPDGTPLAHEDCPMAIAVKENRVIRGMEAVAERPDGTRIPFIPYPTPLHDSSGRLIGAVNMLIDISPHKAAAARQKLLIDELNHRVKNTLATVQSLAIQCFRGTLASDPGQRFMGRLLALSKAHDVLTQENWESASLQEVVMTAAKALGDTGLGQLTIEGPDLRVSPRMALSLSMTIHELSTNATKYGALSSPAGKVTIVWQVEQDGEGRRHLFWRWTEQGGPPVRPPARKGFGTRLLEWGVAHELKADASLAYGLEGVTYTLRAPL
ncbi:PAS domain S-box protein [Telmatospirillum sp. J64-1]|uniref:PAS domain-containing sensor histidine kinase n=1 Tax=Telmatospirillum sp. J64-1 TaxID=2502183 RepID=UPI001C8F2420|nr:PAS domain S-box protein [Telmatospirillum sp. J64-1]